MAPVSDLFIGLNVYMLRMKMFLHFTLSQFLMCPS
jgi:hypothetical protein